MAAEAVVALLLENLKDVLVRNANLLTEGKEVVRWIMNEKEALLEQLEVNESRLQDPNKLRNAIVRAEDLAETYIKFQIQLNHQFFPSNVISVFRSIGMSLELHQIKTRIEGYRDEISSLPEPEDHLPNQTNKSHLRRCLQYFLLFPPNEKVPARRLIVLWVAGGLVHSRIRDDESVEQTADRYLKELATLNMITVHKTHTGKQTFSIDADTRNLLMEEAQKAEFLQDHKGRIRRLVDSGPAAATSSSSTSTSFIQIQGNATVLDTLQKCKDVISFSSFNTEEGSKPGEDIGDFLRRCISAGCFTWLKILDLELVFRPKLPDTLGRLIALKYLGLRWTYLEQLPDSVNKLFNLQVLDLKHTYISVLPRSIWRMMYLRHLYLSEAYRTRFPRPSSKVTLTALHTLWGAFVDEDTAVKGGLDTLLNIRKLGISCRSRAISTVEISKRKQQKKVENMEQQLKAIDKWISKLEFLESLRLKSRDESNEADNLHLTSLVGNRKLSTVYLLGKLDGLVICKLPASLTNVTLSGSGLDLDPLVFLGRLPNLVSLKLLGQSVECSSMSCSKGGFPRLQTLWIWNLENLKDFEAEKGSLPCLKELEIRSCPNLKSFPADKLPSSLPRLETLWIRNLENLKDFEAEKGSLPCLKELEIRSCPNLKSLPADKLPSSLKVRLTCMKQEFLEREGAKYSKVKKGPGDDDQYILTNSS